MNVKQKRAPKSNRADRFKLPYRAWLEVNCKGIKHNVAVIKSLVPRAKIMAVVKSNAYGMGAPQVTHAVRSAGVSILGVGNAEEALALEAYGIKGPFFLLEPPLPEDFPIIVEHNYVLSINSWTAARELSRETVHQGKKVEAHLNINTGMNRLGLKPEEALEKIDALLKLPGVRITGVMTHFSSADEAGKTPTLAQFAKFEKLLNLLKERKITFPVHHVANSAAILDLPNLAFGMARIGILLYGVAPSLSVRQESEFIPAISLKSRVAHLFRIEKGETVSYGRTWTAPDAGNVATLPIGTSDGVPGALSNRGQVLIKGKRYPIAGRICMDLMMIFLGDDRVELWEEVVLLGKQGSKEIGVFDWVRWGDLDPHEILTGLGGKLPKLYL